MALVPLLEQPVVPRPDACDAQLAVGDAEEHRTAEARDLRREVHRSPDAVDVHVPHAGLDVVTARTHLIETERLELHGFRTSADHRVHSDLAVAPALELP